MQVVLVKTGVGGADGRGVFAWWVTPGTGRREAGRGGSLRLGFLVLLVGLGFAAPASGEIYRWVDASGQVHFTQDLSEVPAEQRPAVKRQALEADEGPEHDRLQTFETPERAHPARQAPSARTRGGSREIVRVPVAPAGTGMLVRARLNGSVDAPFLVDTGASDVLIPQSVADRLGIRVGPDTRTKVYATANGLVEHPVVMLRSVDLGGAVVEDVPASISPGMDVGLLGLSFFNHFDYQVDAANGVLTLRRNDLEARGAIRGGRSRAQWSAEFGNLRARMAAVERDLDRQGSAHHRERRRLEELQEDLERQLEALEAEADRARVPIAWRH